MNEQCLVWESPCFPRWVSLVWPFEFPWIPEFSLFIILPPSKNLFFRKIFKRKQKQNAHIQISQVQINTLHCPTNTVFINIGCTLKLSRDYFKNTNLGQWPRLIKANVLGVQSQHGDFSILPRWKKKFVILFSWGKETKGKIWTSICGILGYRKKGSYFRDQMAESFSSSL